MKEPISFYVEGDPKGQPRARACIRGKHAGVYDPGTADAWKIAVAEAWRHVRTEPFTGAVSLSLRFYFQRPKSHFGTGNNSRIVKRSAPLRHTTTPDCDNLAKAVMDVLTRLGAWNDDCQVNELKIQRHWVERAPGCAIRISESE